MSEATGFRAGDELEVEITDLNSEGDGVGRVDGTVVFVRDAVPGDTVQARVEVRLKRHLEAATIRLLRPSDDRIVPVCPHQAVCGGCPLMVLEADTGLAWKVAHLEQTLRRIGGLDVPPCRAVPSPRALEYRNRVAFAVMRNGNRRQLAFRRRGRDARTLVPIERCHLAPPAASELAQALLDRVPHEGARRGAPGRKVSRIEMRGSLSSGEWIAVVHTSGGRWPALERAAAALVESEPRLVGVVRAGEERRGRRSGAWPLAGADHVVEIFGEARVGLGATSFLQVNPAAAAELYHVVGELLHRDGSPERLLDLYCGAGLIGALAAGDVPEVVGVERDAESLQAAQAAEKREGTGRRFLLGDAEVETRRLAESGERFDAVTLNPPRAGAGPGIPALLSALGARRVIVVSCHPAALARDLRRLAESGYAVEEVVAVDMFPQTPHLEAVVALRAGP